MKMSQRLIARKGRKYRPRYKIFTSEKILEQRHWEGSDKVENSNNAFRIAVCQKNEILSS
jgi:hypothetical protein